MRALLAALVLTAVAGCGGSGAPPRIVPVSLSQGSSTVQISAQVAATPADRNRGLMGRKALGPDSGMLFLFPTPVKIGFWMKDTLIPLDIAFISHGRVIEVDTMTPCRVAPCPITTPALGYDQALEVNAGFFERAGISAGAGVDLGEELPKAS